MELGEKMIALRRTEFESIERMEPAELRVYAKRVLEELWALSADCSEFRRWLLWLDPTFDFHQKKPTKIWSREGERKEFLEAPLPVFPGDVKAVFERVDPELGGFWMSLHVVSREEAYRQNYDRIFGKKP